MPRNRGGFCKFCGAWRKSLHRDHIIPKWKGGRDTEENIQLICANCHEDKTREERKGWKPSAETRAKMSASARAKGPPTETARANLRIAARNRAPRTAEHCAAIGAAHRGKKRSAEAIARIRAGAMSRRGRKLSLETRAKMRASHMGLRPSEETREKLRAAWVKRRQWTKQ